MKISKKATQRLKKIKECMNFVQNGTVKKAIKIVMKPSLRRPSRNVSIDFIEFIQKIVVMLY